VGAREGGILKGRQLLLLGVVLGSLVLAGMFHLLGYENTWRLWNVPAMELPFADLRNTTAASIALASGLDPLITNPGDPWGRVLNYPLVWRLFSAMLHPNDTIALGITFVTLFVVGVLAFVPASVDRLSAGLLLLSVFSPAALFAVERGNPDLLIFFLLATAILLARRDVIGGSAGLVALAFALKLYPVSAFPLFLRENRNTFYRLAVGFAILVGLYIGLTYRDLVRILAATPRGKDLAFGVDVFGRWLFPHSGNSLMIPIYAALASIVVLASMRQTQESPKSCATQVNPPGGRYLDAFRVGGGVYVGTFLFGGNFDYKLVFLLFTIPQLVLWARSATGRMAETARWVLAAVVLSMWAPLLREPLALLPSGGTLGFMADELANWMVFLGLAFLIACSAPTWMKDDVNGVLRPRTTQRQSFILLTFASALLALGALAYYVLLPSDLSRAVLGRYSLARLALMSGPLLASLIFASLLVLSIRNSQWGSRAARRIYRGRWLVQRIGVGGCIITALLFLLIAVLQPDWVGRVTAVTIQRLLPYFLLPSLYLGLYWLTDKISQVQDHRGGLAD
jgi:hypothetical protein